MLYGRYEVIRAKSRDLECEATTVMQKISVGGVLGYVIYTTVIEGA